MLLWPYLGCMLTLGDLGLTQTVLASGAVVCGVLLIVFVEPPTPFWTGGDELSGDIRSTLLALLLLALFRGTLFVPFARSFFQLAVLGPRDWLIITAAVVVWCFSLRYVWRAGLFERWLGL
jgi:cation-transporting P-type ATPase E